MSILSSCCNPCCATPTTTNIPGTAGATSISTTTANFVIPAIGNTVTIAVTDSSWMAINGNLWIGGANFLLTGITSLVSITIQTLGVTGDTAVGQTVVAGALIVPGTGNLVFPLAITDGGTGQATAALAFAALYAGSTLPVANGGTAGTTKTTAQTNLGLGQNCTLVNSTGLSQALTATPTLISGASVTIAATGRYLFLARASVDFAGATFASSRQITVKIRNVTTATDLSTSIKNTGVITTTTYPTFDYSVAPVDALATAADVVQVFISISVIASAGTHVVSEASLIAIPLRTS